MPILPLRILPIAASLTLLLGGCTSLDQRLAGVKSASTVATPGNWSSAGSAISMVAPAPDMLAVWWQQFGDVQLDRLIDAAMTAAPDIRSAQARLRQARASRDLAVANLAPSLGASAGVTGSRNGNDPSQTLYAAGFDASWESSIFGGLRYAAEAA